MGLGEGEGRGLDFEEWCRELQVLEQTHFTGEETGLGVAAVGGWHPRVW